MTASAQPFNFMPVAGGAVLAAVACYFLFFAADTYALAPATTSAKLTRKEYRAAHMGYTSEIIGGQTKAVPRVYPEAYVVHFELLGKPAEATVLKDTYGALAIGDALDVTYQKRRITGAFQIMGVTKARGSR